MKKLIKYIFITILIIFSTTLFAEDITGDWYGSIDVSGTNLRLVFHIEASMMGYSGTMDSPDQNAFGIPVSTVTYNENKISLEIKNIGMKYNGLLKNDGTLEGTFTQRGMQLPLNMQREKIDKVKVNRPQTPKPPFPYQTEDVAFYNDNIKLAGTLTIPKAKKKVPAVILISGSGAQNRDEEIFEHKPFAVLADYLTRKGIAVLRYDDRGTAKSEGNFATATTKDLSTDTEAAFNYLLTRDEIDGGKIGLMGHSEGGLIAPMVASELKNVKFIVLLAGPGIPSDELLLLQQAAIGKASGMSNTDLQNVKEFNQGCFDIIKSNSKQDLKVELTRYIKTNIKNLPTNQQPPKSEIQSFTTQQVNALTSPWMVYFINYDPAPALQQVKCTVLAINGEKDLQVPADINLKAIKETLQSSGNNDIEIKKYKNLNHLFQNCKTGLVSEYGQIEETFSPNVMDDISKWINKQTN